MLSRTAGGLFWMARYVERMDNMARLLDAGRRLDSLPRRRSALQNEWASIIIAAGCQDTCPEGQSNATAKSVCAHLIRDEKNPSSIISCIQTARQNAKAVRPSLTSEVWEAINQTRTELIQRLDAELDRKNLSAFLDWVRGRSSLIVGATTETMLRNDRLSFLELGKWFERADATARLLDVKSHVLSSPEPESGTGIDYLQWRQILRAANSATAFRHVYGRNLDAKGVVDLLILNENSPRSLRTAMDRIDQELGELAARGDRAQQVLLTRVCDARARLAQLEGPEIFDFGLHAWLGDFICEINSLSNDASAAFGFGGKPASNSSENVH